MQLDQTPNHFHHIVLFKFHENVEEATINEAVDRLKELGESDGILEWNIERSQDSRKGIVLVENAVFADEASFNLFHNSTKHQQVGEFMSGISDWLIGDYIQKQ